MNTIIRAFARNRVFANLVMITVMTAGILSAFLMVREDMPDLQLDTIVITVSYPGADPEEVEEGISRKVEEAIDGLEGVDEYTSTSAEGISSTVIDVVDGYDADQLLDRVRNEIDSITTFPDDSENPSIFRPQIQKAVISLALLSEMPEARLKEWADTVKKEIHRLPGVSQVNLSGTRSYEISVEITQADLMKYDLSINEVAQIIADNSLNQSGGTLKTSGQEIRLRTLGRKYTGSELGRIKIIGGADGQTLYLDDIAQIRDEFTENHLAIKANGQPAVLLNVLAADEDTITIADTVRGYQEKVKATLPEDSDIIVLSDNTESTRSNLDTLLSNAVMGLVLVFILLWLFMDTKISFWAGMGIPISLLGGLAIVHFAGITLNKITLFGLIMVLGIVADDAIVVGESIFFHRKNGASALDAVVKGVSEVGMPVLAAILTTIVAFFPLYHIKGVMGKFIVALPTAVIACLSVSLIECMVMLPAHLNDIAAAGETPVSRFRVIAWIERFHRFTVNSMEWAAQKVYLPVLTLCVRHRYLFVCLCCAVLFLCAGLVLGGTIKFNVFPRQASGIVVATVEFPEGTPFATTQAAVERLEDAALRAGALLETGELSGTGQSLVTNILTTVGQGAGEKMGGIKSASPNVGGVRVSLLDAEISGIHSDDFIHAWEEATGHISGVQSLDFSASRSGPPGAPIEIALQGEQLSDINAAADRIMARLNTIKGVSQVFSDNAPGKNELKLRLKKEAQYLGLDMSDLSRQIFGAYYGAEAVTIQRGNDEVEVRVRLTSDERQTMESLTDYRVKAKENTWVPLSAVADITYGPGYSTITRKDGLRQVKVSAKVNLSQIVAGEVIAELEQGLFKELKRDYPDIRIILEGDAKRSAESFSSLYVWIPISIMGMFAIIATMFRSYVQPLLILFTIPFGLVGAVIGHFIMGHMLSLLSVFGMVALTGVVVNDAIVLLSGVNTVLATGVQGKEAVLQAACDRFRPILLTTLTTCLGLLPLMLESSEQAQFLIPAAISMTFGLMSSTLVTLVFFPVLLSLGFQNENQFPQIFW
mgnify:FL=1